MTTRTTITTPAGAEKFAEAHVRDLAARFGWKLFHCPAPMRQVGKGRFVPEPLAKGFPDYLLLRGGRMVVIETKADGRYPDAAQRAWLEAFQAFGDAVGDGLTPDGRGVSKAKGFTMEAFDHYRHVDVLVVRPADLDKLAEVLR